MEGEKRKETCLNENSVSSEKVWSINGKLKISYPRGLFTKIETSIYRSI